MAIVISLSLYLFLLGFLLVKTKGKFIALLILSPIAMGAPAYQDFIVRKDILGIIFLIICLKILDLKNKEYLGWRYLATNFIAIIAILSHESFFFFALPAIVVVISKLQKDANSVKNISHAFFVLTPSFLAFGFCAFFKGDSMIANAINLSWIQLWRVIEPGNCCFEQPSAAIDSLQWTTRKGLQLSYSTLFAFSKGIYVPLAWLISMLISGYFLMSYSKISNYYYKKFLNILIFQIIVISPLFVLGWDFGRWIFLWSISSLVLFIYGINFDNKMVIHAYPYFKKIQQGYINQYISRNSWLLLLFGIPGCCWSFWGFIGPSSVGYYFGKFLAYPLVFLKNLLS